MGRIRTVKPDFFRHELLQDLEIANPGKHPMLVFAGLWTVCDKLGRFEWKPRTLKLDLLPFLPFDMADTLGVLVAAGMVQRYSVDGVEYGCIPSFEDHQRISGKEAQSDSKIPPPPLAQPEKQKGSAGEAPEKHPGAQEGKGREEEGNKEGNGERATGASPLESDPEPITSLPTMAGAVCVALKASGIGLVNPSHPDLLALLESGVDIGAFVAAAEKAKKAEKATFAYVLGIVKGQAADSQRLAANARASPQKTSSHSGFESKNYRDGVAEDGSFT